MRFSAHQESDCFHPNSKLPHHNHAEKMTPQKRFCILESNDVLTGECVFTTLRSDRKILDRVLRSSKPLPRSPCGGISCLASGHPLHRLITHSRAAILSQFRMLTRWFEQHSTGSRIAPASAATSFCGISEIHLRLCPKLSWFRTCGCVLACTHYRLRLCSIYLHNLLQCFSEMMLRVLVFYHLDSGALPDLLSRFATANRSSESSLAPLFLSRSLYFFFRLSVKKNPHAQHDLPFAVCSLQLSHCVVSSMTASSAMSVFLCSLTTPLSVRPLPYFVSSY